MTRILALAAALLCAGCFDSLVSGQCQPGYVPDGDRCALRTSADAGVDTFNTTDARTIDATPGGGGGSGDPDADPTAADARVDADPTAADARADADPTAPDAGADADPTAPDADPTAPDAGADADPTAPDADPTAPDAGADAPTTSTPDAAPDVDAAPLCEPEELFCAGVCIDPMTNPDNCGRCGNRCASGLCSAGVCVGAPPGHVVLVGHDYSSWRLGTARLLGNAVGLAFGAALEVAVWQGDATNNSIAGTRMALSTGLALEGRAWHEVSADSDLTTALRTCEVFVVMAQRGQATDLAALGASWKARLDTFLSRGGIVVVLEGTGGPSHQVLVGAGLMAVGSHVDVTGQTLRVSAPGDSVASGVPSSYFAETTSVAFAGTAAPAVVVDGTSLPVVLHTVAP